MPRHLLILLILVNLTLIISGCYYDSEEDLYPPVECDTANVSFSQDIQPIFAISCLSCHNTFNSLGDVNLEGHAAVLKYALDGSLVGSVQHESGYDAMPQGASKLEVCKIKKIKAWVDAGAPNN